MMAKYLDQQRLNQSKWFELVVRNALAFLKTSVENTKESPRNAIIELYTAVELLFKARLMKEHWTLIVTKPEDAKKFNFEKGDFRSISLDQAVARLKNICGETFEEEALQKFKALGEHRNQIVHFAHTNFAGKSANEDVVIEHWGTWYYLHELIKNQWCSVFEDFRSDFVILNELVMINHNFLEAKYEVLKKQINIKHKKGRELIECTSCGFQSALMKWTYDYGKGFKCEVCDVVTTVFKEIESEIPCKNCGASIPYFLTTEKKCYSCAHPITKKYALKKYTEIYKKEDYAGRYDDERDPIAFCHSCKSSTPSVVNLNGVWVCVLCEEIGWSAIDCEHCDTFVSGNVDEIIYVGCHFCKDKNIKQWDERLTTLGINT